MNLYIGLGLIGGLLFGEIARRLSKKRLAEIPMRLYGPRLFLNWILATFGFLTVIYGVWLALGPRNIVKPTKLSSQITYEKFWITPKAMVHLAAIDLSGNCLAVIPVRPMDDGQIAAKTVLEFARQENAEIAINANFYFPFDEYPHWETYPKSGELVTPLGAMVVDGTVIAEKATEWWDGGYLNFDKSGYASIGPRDDTAKFAISGKEILLANGNIIVQTEDQRNYPRTLIGLNSDKKMIYFLAVDGKQAGYSDGTTLETARDALIERGAANILAFDGGGSTTLVARENGELKVLNRPIHTRIPNRHRPVASSIGFRRVEDCN